MVQPAPPLSPWRMLGGPVADVGQQAGEPSWAFLGEMAAARRTRRRRATASGRPRWPVRAPPPVLRPRARTAAVPGAPASPLAPNLSERIGRRPTDDYGLCPGLWLTWCLVVTCREITCLVVTCEEDHVSVGHVSVGHVQNGEAARPPDVGLRRAVGRPAGWLVGWLVGRSVGRGGGAAGGRS